MEGHSAVERAIEFAVRAAAFRQAAKSFPRAAETMVAAAAVNSAKCKIALRDVVAGHGNAPASHLP